MHAQKMIKQLDVLLGLTVLVASVAQAAFEYPVDIAQPIVTAEGIYISRVTYVTYSGSNMPGYLVPSVGRESCVLDDVGQTVNRNVASLLGIRTGVTYLRERDKESCDTLRVFIDLSNVGDKKPPGGWSVMAAVEATVECVLTAAYESRSGWDRKMNQRVLARFVALEVLGLPEYAHYGGVFAFDALGQLPRKRQFDY